MEREVDDYIFERHGIRFIPAVRQQLFEDLKESCSQICEIGDLDCCQTVEDFAKKIYTESKLDKVFWVNIKRHFFGGEHILSFINSRNKTLNLFHLDFLKDKYWCVDHEMSTSKPERNMIETESLGYGVYGEELLLRYLRKTDVENFYMSSGKLLLHSLPCFGATPDYLVLDRKKIQDNSTNLFGYVEIATGIAEVKTTLTPENFSIENSEFLENNLHCLVESAIKNRHLLTGLARERPKIFNITKGKCKPRVNWITESLMKILVESYEESCEILVRDFERARTFHFSFSELQKKIYVNFFTSTRGRQILSECMAFADNNRRQTNIDMSAFYLYLNSKDKSTPEFYVKIRFVIPKNVLQYFEKELNKKFYSQYIEQCLHSALK